MNECAILLVNDDALVIAALHEALAGARHKLFVAPTVEAAIHALKERRCAFVTVFVDLDDGVHALALLGTVHSCCPQLPLVALIPWGEWGLYEQAFLRGATSLLDKPVTADELRPMLLSACASASCVTPRLPGQKRRTAVAQIRRSLHR